MTQTARTNPDDELASPRLPDEPDPERMRLQEPRPDQGTPWHRWGPYLAARQWGTVREDYSPNGTAWDSFPHDHARSRAYRWGEDGLLGICDSEARLCFAMALWNEADPILKERLFGLTGSEGNHGEDVKEYYFFLDNTPTHSYMKALYKYPQRAFPYAQLVEENRRRGKHDPEYELLDTGIFAEDRYFDVFVEYAKAAPDDIVIRITAFNRGPEPAPLHVLPTLWFRNTWSWGRDDIRPELHREDGGADVRLMRAQHPTLGEYWLACQGTPDLLFTENETNAQRLWGVPNRLPYVKDSIDDAVVHGAEGAVNREGAGTKVAAHYVMTIAPGASETVLLRLSAQRPPYAGSEGGTPGRIGDPRTNRDPADLRMIRSTTPRGSSQTDRQRRTGSTSRSPTASWATTPAWCSARRWPACCGVNSTTATTWLSGSTATPASRRRRSSTGTVATPTGATSTTAT